MLVHLNVAKQCPPNFLSKLSDRACHIQNPADFLACAELSQIRTTWAPRKRFCQAQHLPSGHFPGSVHNASGELTVPQSRAGSCRFPDQQSSKRSCQCPQGYAPPPWCQRWVILEHMVSDLHSSPDQAAVVLMPSDTDILCGAPSGDGGVGKLTSKSTQQLCAGSN